MKQYFFKISITYTDKNKLYKELREWIQKHDGTFLTSIHAYRIFKSDIKAQVVNLNRKHSRCKPIEVLFFKLSPKGDRRSNSRFWFLERTDLSSSTQILKQCRNH